MTTAPVAQARRNPAVVGLGKLGGLFRWYWEFSKKKPLGGLGLFLIVAIGLVAILGPYIKPMDELKIHSKNIFQKPQWTHGFFLGADHLGRDVLSRLMIGARISLTVAVCAVAIGGSIGFVVGLLSGYYKGWIETILQRIVDVLMSFPTIVLALAIVSVMGRDAKWIILAIGITQIPSTSRVVRSVVLTVKNMEYVQAARTMGASDRRILLQHISPQTFAPLLILITAALGLAILTESSLSFLGLGTAPPKPSWGSMLSGPTLANVERAPWNAVWPGLVLTITVFSFNLVGDALRDTLDPRLRK